jgi:hypothetical protein
MSDAETVWLPAGRKNGTYRVYHTDEDCSRLASAEDTREVSRDSLSDDYSECKECAGEATYGDNGGIRDHLESLQEAAQSGFEIRTDGGLEGHTSQERPHILTEDDTPALDVYLNGERLNKEDGGPKHWLFETDIEGDGAFYEVTVGIQNGLGVGAERWQTFDRSDQDGRLVSFEEVPVDDQAVKHRFEGVETDDVVQFREVQR